MVDETRIVNKRKQMSSLSAPQAALRWPLQNLPPLPLTRETLFEETEGKSCHACSSRAWPGLRGRAPRLARARALHCACI